MQNKLIVTSGHQGAKGAWKIGLVLLRDGVIQICGPRKFENVMEEIGFKFFNGKRIEKSVYKGSKKMRDVFEINVGDWQDGIEELERVGCKFYSVDSFRRLCR